MKLKEMLDINLKEEVWKNLYDATSEMAKEYEKAYLDAQVYWYFLQSCIEEITLKQAYERYKVVSVNEEMRQPYYKECDGRSVIAPTLEYECYFKLVSREQPLMLTNEEWGKTYIKFLGRLQKILPLFNKEK